MKLTLPLFLALALFAGASNASGQRNGNMMTEAQKMANYSSATAWKGMYFIAITKKKPGEIDLSPAAMNSLLSTVNAKSAIYTGATVEPKYLINAKGVTSWIAMWAYINHANPEILKSLGTGQGLALVPTPWVNSAFGSHVNWPAKMLHAHNLELKGYTFVAIPFLIPHNAPALKKLSQSIKAPDGSLEVFGFDEFNEKNPEALLIAYEEIGDFIRRKRPDIVRP